MYIGVSPSSLKNNPRLSSQIPPLNQQIVQAPFLGNPLYIGFSWTTPPQKKKKIKIFQWIPPKLKFFTLSHLLKVTKFLVKISQFEFLVTTEENNFAYIINFFCH